MDAGLRTPLIEAFRRPDAPRDLRLEAAGGRIAPRGLEQLALLMLLVDDEDAEVRAAAERTLEALPPAGVAAVLGRSDATGEMLKFFAARGHIAAAGAAESDAPVVDADTSGEWDQTAAGDGDDTTGQDETLSVTQQIQQMSIVQRVRAAMKGSREMRAILIRDPNKLVASAVLSSPKLTLAEVESFAKMANVGEEVLRSIATNRAWVKSYGVTHGLARNPKTPVALSLSLLNRLVERDVKVLASDRNVPEPLRLAARKKIAMTRG